MTKIIWLTLFGSILSLTVAACGEMTLPPPVTATPGQFAPGFPLLRTPSNPSAGPTAVECATATPQSAQSRVTATGVVGPAGRTTPSAIQPTLSPQQLATLEAAEARSGKPGPTLPSGTIQLQSVPVCPTPTPTK